MTSKEKLKQEFILAIMAEPSKWTYAYFPQHEIRQKGRWDSGPCVKFGILSCTIHPHGTACGMQSYGLLTKKQFKKIAEALNVLESVLNEKEREVETITAISSIVL